MGLISIRLDTPYSVSPETDAPVGRLSGSAVPVPMVRAVIEGLLEHTRIEATFADVFANGTSLVRE